MKQILTIALVALITPIFGQTFFDAGIKFGIGPTLMYNQNIFDDGVAYDHVLTSGTAIGGKLGVNFAGRHGVTVDYMSAKSKQDFDIPGGSHEYVWKHNDVLLMYRYSGNGAFVEIGPKFSFMNEVNTTLPGAAELDVTSNFVDNYKSVVFGFGSYLIGSDVLTLQAGVRLHWAFDDMISEQGRSFEPSYPATTRPQDYPTYEKTTATAAQFMLELNYAFGRFAKASCSQRWRLILFD